MQLRRLRHASAGRQRELAVAAEEEGLRDGERVGERHEHPLDAFEIAVDRLRQRDRRRRDPAGAEPRDDGRPDEFGQRRLACTRGVLGDRRRQLDALADRDVDRAAVREDEHAIGRPRIAVAGFVLQEPAAQTGEHGRDDAAGRDGPADERTRGAGALDVVDRRQRAGRRGGRHRGNQPASEDRSLRPPRPPRHPFSPHGRMRGPWCDSIR